MAAEPDSYPVARVSFYKGKPFITGRQLIEAVKQVLRDYGDPELEHYYETRRFENGDLYRIGRRSCNDNRNVDLVIWAQYSEWIDPSRVYTQIDVVSIARTSDRRLCQSATNRETIDFVRSFGELLKTQLEKPADKRSVAAVPS